ncbi:VWA domain-containing protein, partial [Enterococcus faecalis]
MFLIDNSASMSAADVSPTRLDEAKRRITALIERMGSGDTAMVVSFAD